MTTTERQQLESELARKGAELRFAIDARHAASQRLAEVVRRASVSGISEAEIAKVAGTTRTTVRRSLGKAR